MPSKILIQPTVFSWFKLMTLSGSQTGDGAHKRANFQWGPNLSLKMTLNSNAKKAKNKSTKLN